MQTGQRTRSHLAVMEPLQEKTITKSDDDPERLMRLTPKQGDDDDTLARVNPKQRQRRWDADETVSVPTDH